ASGWSHAISQPNAIQPVLTNRSLRGKQSSSGNVCSKGSRRFRRSCLIWSKLAEYVALDRNLPGQDPHRCKTGRFADTAANQIRTGDKSEDRQSAWFDNQSRLSADR